ncbi:MAG: GerMN domain-containing protein [Christensenellales bacterium]
MQLLGIDISDGVITINFSGDFTKIAEQSDGGVQAMRALMLTCTRYPGIKKSGFWLTENPINFR